MLYRSLAKYKANNGGNVQAVPYMDLKDHTYTATPVYAVVQDTHDSSDKSKASSPAEGVSSPSRVKSIYPETTLIENDLYE